MFYVIIFQYQVKYFSDGAQFNTNHEMLFYMWSSALASSCWNSKFVLAAIPMRLLPTKKLRAKANRAIVELIAWDSALHLNEIIFV